MTQFLLASGTLLKREMVRFLRQKNRVIGALGTPLVFWILMGSGLKGSFKGDIDFLHYFFPGTILLILLFTAIFSTISIIEDRREGFLQAVLVSPVPNAAFVLGKLLGGTFLALAQGLLFMIVIPFLGISLGFSEFLFLLLLLLVTSFGLTGLGFIFAWRLDSTQGFHAIMNLFLMPLWLLSGALFPFEGVPKWLEWVMIVNPLTYAVSGLHIGFFGHFSSPLLFISNPWICLSVSLFFAVLMFILSVRISRK